MMPVFYTSPDSINNESLAILGAEAHHLGKVMRLKKGDPVMVIDGVGNGFRCEIGKKSAKSIQCKIHSRIRNYGEPISRVTVAAGLSVGTKFDDVIQRVTELGAVRIIPVLTEKSKVKLEDEKRVKNKLSRWRKVALASVKQSGRSVLPEIIPPTSFTQLFDRFDDLGQVIIFNPTRGGQGGQGGQTLTKAMLNNDSRQVTVLIGPESGFTLDEVNLARKAGAKNVTLGHRVLRTENAVPTAVALVMFLLDEFS